MRVSEFGFRTEREADDLKRPWADIEKQLFASYKKYLVTESSEEAGFLREEIARACIALYYQCDDVSDLSHNFRNILGKITEVRLLDPDKYIARLTQHAPDPIEAISATLKNFEIADLIGTSLAGFADGVLLSGANAWGPFFAVRHPAYESMRNTPGSDVDVVAIFDDVDAILQGLKSLARQGLISEGEMQRFHHFKKLSSEKRADVFSMRSFYANTEISLHAYPKSTVIALVEGSEQKNEQGIGFLHDFRPSFPNNVRKFGGYPTLDFLSGNTKLFQPTIELVHDVGEKDSSFLCDSPTGKIDQGEISVGLTLFFFLIAPMCIGGQSAFYETTRRTMLERLRKASNQEPIRFLFREERMASMVSRSIKDSLI